MAGGQDSMKPTNLKAVKDWVLMDYLTRGLKWDGDSRKINNSKSFMPLYIGVAYDCFAGRVFYLVHYGEQNGDLMADPEMNFLRINYSKTFIPILYRNDYVGVMNEAAWIEDGKMLAKVAEQHDMTDFANTWLSNIREQQNLQHIKEEGPRNGSSQGQAP